MKVWASNLLASSGGKEIECVISPTITTAITRSCEPRSSRKFVEPYGAGIVFTLALVVQSCFILSSNCGRELDICTITVFVFGNWMQQSHSPFITSEFFPQSSTSWIVFDFLKGTTTIVCFSLI